MTRPLALADAITVPEEPASIEGWIDGQDLATLPASAITARIRELTTDAVAFTRGARVYESARAHLVDRAFAAVGEHADELVERLRPAWAPAAEVIEQGRAVGITGDTTAEQVLNDDAMIPVWRQLPTAVETLTELDRTVMRVRAVGGYALGHDEMPRTTLGQWIDAAATAGGPPALLLPSAYPEPHHDNEAARGEPPAFLAWWRTAELEAPAKFNPLFLPAEILRAATARDPRWREKGLGGDEVLALAEGRSDPTDDDTKGETR